MANRRKSAWIYASLAIVVAGAGTYWYVDHRSAAKPAAQTAQSQTVKVTKGAISYTVSGTSQLTAKDSQNVVVPVDGVIATMNLTRNQAVKKGDVLLELSVPSYNTSLQEAEITLQQLQKDLADLESQRGHMTITAPMDGKITLENSFQLGGTVNKDGKIAVIDDPSQLTVTLSFPYAEAVQLKTGDTVDLTVDGYMQTKSGKVAGVSRDVTADADGTKLVAVKVNVANDGTLAAGTKVTGSYTVSGTTVSSPAQAAMEIIHTESLFSGASGTVKALNVKTGQTVHKGDVIATLTNATLDDSIITKQAAIESQKIKVQDAEQNVEKLKITAPFDGFFSADFANSKTNVLNSYPAGASINSGTLLGAVASLTTMQLPIAVDELDLTKIQVGQKAQVKVDALSTKSFEGEVTQISNVGTTSNGVTTYDAIVSVQNTDQNDLKYGMTATAKIYIQDKKDILVLPNQALQTENGKRYVTLVKADGTVEEKHEVTVGIKSDTMVEIVSGLNEGDQVQWATSRKTTTTANQQQFPGGPPDGGGFQGGGFPGGGTQGGGNTGGGTRN